MRPIRQPCSLRPHLQTHESAGFSFQLYQILFRFNILASLCTCGLQLMDHGANRAQIRLTCLMSSWCVRMVNQVPKAGGYASVLLIYWFSTEFYWLLLTLYWPLLTSTDFYWLPLLSLFWLSDFLTSTIKVAKSVRKLFSSEFGHCWPLLG